AGRAGAEGTPSRGVRGSGLRRFRSVGLARARLQGAATAAIDVDRISERAGGGPRAGTRTSRLAARSGGAASIRRHGKAGIAAPGGPRPGRVIKLKYKYNVLTSHNTMDGPWSSATPAAAPPAPRPGPSRRGRRSSPGTIVGHGASPVVPPGT